MSLHRIGGMNRGQGGRFCWKGGFVGEEEGGWKGVVFVHPPKTLRYCMYPDGCPTRHTRHSLHDVAAPAPCFASIGMAADSRAIRLAAGRRRKDKKWRRKRVSWPSAAAAAAAAAAQSPPAPPHCSRAHICRSQVLKIDGITSSVVKCTVGLFGGRVRGRLEGRPAFLRFFPPPPVFAAPRPCAHTPVQHVHTHTRVGTHARVQPSLRPGRGLFHPVGVCVGLCGAHPILLCWLPPRGCARERESGGFACLLASSLGRVGREHLIVGIAPLRCGSERRRRRRRRRQRQRRRRRQKAEEEEEEEGLGWSRLITTVVSRFGRNHTC